MRKFFVLCLLGAGLFSAAVDARAGEIDILVDKLVEKGILSSVEAQIILDETKEEAAKEIAQGKSSLLPEWVQKMQFKGDLRLRYQYNRRQGDAAIQHRARYRLRLGVETKIVDKVKIAVGLATGSTDPRSTNVTMNNSFEKPEIRLDYAFVKYDPASWVSLYGGRILRAPVLWEPGDFLWDSDITPQGGAVTFNKSITGTWDLFFNAGLFVLDESASDKSDPYMYYFQPGTAVSITDNINAKAAVTLYGFSSVKGAVLDQTAGSNTLSGGKLKYDYNSISPAAEISINNPLQWFTGPDSAPWVHYLGFFGEYVYNPDPGQNNKGYSWGAKIGDKDVKDKQQWQLRYMWRYMEKDSWLDVFPDSDAYGGRTGVKGHEVVFEYGLNKNLSLALDYYYMERIKEAGSSKTYPENLVQVDLNLKW